MNIERFKKIFTDEIDQIKRRSGLSKRRIYTQLGNAIGVGWDSIEKYATGKPASIQPVTHRPDYIERLAQALRNLGSLQGDLFEEFLVTGGHPNPLEVLNPKLFELPPRDRFFTGRNEKLDELLDTVLPGRIVILIGPGGVGKTTLVAEFIYQVLQDSQDSERFPDGIFYYEFYKHPSVNQALETTAMRFGREEKAFPNPREAARISLRNKQALLVFDGAEAADDLDLLLSVRQNCAVLIVSRKDFPSYQFKRVTLDIFPMQEAIRLLKLLSSPEDISQTSVWKEPDSHDDHAKQICELLGCLPLALLLAGSQLRSYYANTSDFLKVLEASPLRLLHEERRQHRSVRVLLEAMTTNLEEIAKKILSVVGVLSYESFNVEAIAAALEIPDVDIRLELNNLCIISLIKFIRSGNGRYQVEHRLIHTFVSSAQNGFVIQPNELRQLVSYLTRQANTLSQAGSIGLRQLRLEAQHIISIAENTNALGLWNLTVQILEATDTYFDLQSHRSEQLSLLNSGIRAARELNEPSLEISLLNDIGSAHSDLGDEEEAIKWFTQGLEVADRTGNRQGQTSCLINLASCLNRIGKIQQAITQKTKALGIARELDDQLSESMCLGNLGIYYNRLGRYREAINFFQESIVISREIDDPQREANQLNNLGRSYYLLEEIETAIEFHKQALEVNQEIGARIGEAESLCNLGIAYDEIRQYQQAIDCYQEALQITAEIGLRRLEGITLGNLAYTHENLANHDLALGLFKQALEIAVETGDPLAESNHLNEIANSYYRSQRFEDAIETYSQALNIAIELPFPEGERNRLYNLGRLYFRIIEYDKAIPYLLRSLELAVELESSQGQLLCLTRLFQTYLGIGQIAEAKQYIAQRIEANSDNAMVAHTTLGVLANMEGKQYQAVSHYEHAIEIFYTSCDLGPILEGELREKKALALIGLGRKSEAIDSLIIAIDKWSREDLIDRTLYELLADLAEPPDGIADLLALIESAGI